jgi:hypothetical protein
MNAAGDTPGHVAATQPVANLIRRADELTRVWE